MYSEWETRSFDSKINVLTDGSLFILGVAMMMALRQFSKKLVRTRYIQSRLIQNTLEEKQEKEKKPQNDSRVLKERVLNKSSNQDNKISEKATDTTKMRFQNRKTPNSPKTRHLNTEMINQKAYASMYRFLFYFVAVIIEILILKDENWIFTPFQYTLTWSDNKTPFKVRAMYIFEFSYYITGIWYLLIEKKMKDFNIMVVHHIATISLIFSSFYYNMFRYGITIMFLHDISDPLLEFAKINIYLKNTKIANLLFSVFGFVFLFMRVILFPSFIILPIIYYSFLYGCKLFFIFSLILSVLFILHILWARIIIKMAHKLFVKEELLQKDDREEIVDKSK
ncbi:hypothetical protein M153_2230006183 [Pseudoloma neurophilia]|uniref:TLC domain-containing protein n=1 Tax=Pseudoloma neurophilia TaxID=146866 RepID=A0A0R0LYZ6_9MICR|nr:hypothetical protein M153_2230006183 [Pseudoloma neurophilia]